MEMNNAYNLTEQEKYCAQEIFKVVHDGGHYVAKYKETIRAKKKAPTKFFDPVFDELYIEALDKKITKFEKQVQYIKNGFEDQGEIRSQEEIEETLCRKVHNIHGRRKRFMNKANLHKWSFFVTFTYDDKKQTEETFRTRLKKCIGNLHTRRGWLLMGVFERAPETKRLHFHGLVHVPKYQMIGRICKVREYNPLSGKVEEHHENSFFLSRFGRNDFAPINCENLFDLELYHEGKSNKQVIDYILKYILKNDEKVFYTRGIPSYFEVPADKEHIVSGFFDFVQKFVLFDDVLDYVDERSVVMRC